MLGKHDWLTFQSYKYSTRGVLNKRRGLEQLRISDLDVISDNVWNILESSEKLMEGQLLVRDAFVDATRYTKSRLWGSDGRRFRLVRVDPKKGWEPADSARASLRMPDRMHRFPSTV